MIIGGMILTYLGVLFVLNANRLERGDSTRSVLRRRLIGKR
jgi:hypothetical protein